MGKIIREAKSEDFPELENMEQTVWEKEGVDTFSRAYFDIWLEVFARGFRVVENNGKIVAYSYFIRVKINDFNDPEELKSFTQISGNGYTDTTHNLDGNHHLGITITSLNTGAGLLLLKDAMIFSEEQQKGLLLASRIPYLQSYKEKFPPGEQNSAVSNFLEKCVKIEKGEKSPDPLINFYLSAGLQPVRILPNFMKDPKSNDFAVLLKK